MENIAFQSGYHSYAFIDGQVKKLLHQHNIGAFHRKTLPFGEYLVIEPFGKMMKLTIEAVTLCRAVYLLRGDILVHIGDDAAAFCGRDNVVILFVPSGACEPVAVIQCLVEGFFRAEMVQRVIFSPFMDNGVAFPVKIIMAYKPAEIGKRHVFLPLTAVGEDNAFRMSDKSGRAFTVHGVACHGYPVGDNGVIVKEYIGSVKTDKEHFSVRNYPFGDIGRQPVGDSAAHGKMRVGFGHMQSSFVVR